MIITATDIGGRPYMEDEMSIQLDLLPNLHYYAIFDGHGTGDVSKFLKTHMKTVVKAHISQLDSITPQGVIEALYNSYQSVVESLPLDISRYAGSTAVVAIKFGEHLWVANCGDSRAIMNFYHSPLGITNDHKPDRKDEYDRITGSGGKVFKNSPEDVPRVNGNLALSRAIGDFELYPHVTWKPEIYYTRILKGNDYLLLATDGVWDVFSNDDIVPFINKHLLTPGGIKEIGNLIIQEARRRHSTDNIAVVLILI